MIEGLLEWTFAGGRIHLKSENQAKTGPARLQQDAAVFAVGVSHQEPTGREALDGLPS